MQLVVQPVCFCCKPISPGSCSGLCEVYEYIADWYLLDVLLMSSNIDCAVCVTLRIMFGQKDMSQARMIALLLAETRNSNIYIQGLQLVLLEASCRCLQSTLLKALAGKMGHSGLQVEGEILYNGTPLTEFLPQRTAVYVEQEDQHLPELTVRETFDFAARCQGVGGKAGTLLLRAAHVTVVWCCVCCRFMVIIACGTLCDLLAESACSLISPEACSAVHTKLAAAATALAL